MSKMITKVWLDAGHGGKDGGASGNGLVESQVALAITRKVGAILKDHGMQVGYSRTTDVYVGLSERARMANKFGAGIFVSIHLNAYRDGSARGLETFHFPKAVDGQKLATAIQDRIKADKLYSVDRGVKSANFAVLRETAMTAVLVETGFITNAGDSIILRDKQDEMAVAIAKGILQQAGIRYLPSMSKPVDKPVSDETDGTIYRVVAGSFSDRSNADALVEKLKSQGYGAFIAVKQ